LAISSIEGPAGRIVDILRRLTQSGSTHYQRERPSAIGRLHQAEDRKSKGTGSGDPKLWGSLTTGCSSFAGIGTATHVVESTGAASGT